MIKATRKNYSLRSLSLVATLFFLTILKDNDSSSHSTEIYERIGDIVKATTG